MLKYRTVFGQDKSLHLTIRLMLVVTVRKVQPFVNMVTARSV